jgi:hypothetical protein
MIPLMIVNNRKTCNTSICINTYARRSEHRNRNKYFKNGYIIFVESSQAGSVLMCN